MLFAIYLRHDILYEQRTHVEYSVLSLGTRLFAVAAHEFGHSLGLSHSDVEGSLMYPWYQNFDYDLELSQDDKLGIQSIYGKHTLVSSIDSHG